MLSLNYLLHVLNKTDKAGVGPIITSVSHTDNLSPTSDAVNTSVIIQCRNHPLLRESPGTHSSTQRRNRSKKGILWTFLYRPSVLLVQRCLSLKKSAGVLVSPGLGSQFSWDWPAGSLCSPFLLVSLFPPLRGNQGVLKG